MAEAQSVHASSAESARLTAVQACRVLDTLREPAFDSIVFTAAQLFRVPMAMFAIVGASRVWAKSRVGPLPQEWPRTRAMCAEVVQDNAMLVVEDCLVDLRYAQTALVSGVPNIRFYAGVPVLGPGSLPIGSLSVLDSQPRTVPDRARIQLEQLGKEAEEILRWRVLG